MGGGVIIQRWAFTCISKTPKIQGCYFFLQINVVLNTYMYVSDTIYKNMLT